MNKHIANRVSLKIALSIFFILWIFFIAYFNMQISKTKDDFLQGVNIAGKQRMLTQSIVFNAYKFYQTQDYNIKDKLSDLYMQMLQNTTHLNEQYLKDKVLFKGVEQDVKKYLVHVERFIDHSDIQNLQTLDAQSSIMFEKSIEVVELLKKEFSKEQNYFTYFNIFIGVVSFIVSIVFIRFVFFPTANRMNDSEKKLLKLNEELNDIVKRKTDSLHKSLDYISSLLSASDEGQIIVDANYEVVDFNKKAKEIFEKLNINITIEELFEWQQELFSTDLRENFDYTFKYEKKEYKMHFKKLNENRFLISFFDITQEVKENRRRGVIYNSQQAIVVVSDGVHIKDINAIFFKEFGFKDLEDFKSKHNCICELFLSKEGYSYLMPEVDGVHWIRYIDEHKEKTHQVLMINKDGREKIYEVRSSGNIFAEEYEQEEVVIFNDITELQEKNTLLLSQSKDAAIGEMISMIAHQWRQPLTILSTILSRIKIQKEMQMLDDISFDEAMAKSAAQIAYMSKTIEDFRDFFKNSDIQERISIKEIIETPKNLIDALLTSKDVAFYVDYEVDPNMHISTFISKLLQVMLNIYKNAIDQIVLKNIEEGVIKVRVFKKEDRLHIEICDNALGIDNAVLPRLFEPYFSTKSKNGTGLGLYMSKKIVQEILGGNINAYNKENGACFEVLLRYEL